MVLNVISKSTISLALGGDRKAFHSILDAHIDRLYSIAYRVTQDQGLAEDAVQDSFLKLLQNQPKLKDDTHLRAWLSKVLTHASIDLLRVRKKTVTVDVSDSPEPQNTFKGPEEVTMQKEEQVLLNQALAQLSPETRAAVLLHVVEGIKFREIAKIVGSSKSSVQRDTQSGLSKLRAFLNRSGLAVTTMGALTSILKGVPVIEAPSDLTPKILSQSEKVLTQAELSSSTSILSFKTLSLSAILGGIAILAILTIFDLPGGIKFRNEGEGEGYIENAGVIVEGDDLIGSVSSDSIQPVSEGTNTDSEQNTSISTNSSNKNSTVASVSGTVWLNGKLISGAELILRKGALFDLARSYESLLSRENLFQKTKTNRRGQFQFKTLPQGSYILEAHSKKGISPFYPIRIEEGDRSFSNLRLEIEPGKRLKAVVDLGDNSAIPEGSQVHYIATIQDGASFLFKTVPVLPDGSVTFEPLYSSRLDPEILFFDVPGYSFKSIGHTQTPTISFEKADFVEGTIVDQSSGEPISKARIAAFSPPEKRRSRAGRRDSRTLRFVEQAYTDDQGRFTLDSLPSTELIFRAEVEGYRSQIIEGKENLNIQLQPGKRIQGTVLADGERVPYHTVDIFIKAAFENPQSVFQQGADFFMDPFTNLPRHPDFFNVITDENGKFESPILDFSKNYMVSSRGRWLWSSRTKPELSNQEIEIEDPSKPISLPFDLSLMNPVISGVVLHEKQGRGAFATVKLEAFDGKNWRMSGRATADQAGRFKIHPLSLNQEIQSYRLLAEDSSGNKAKYEFPKLSEKEIQLVLTRGDALSGYVLDPAGNPLRGVEIQLTQTHKPGLNQLHKDKKVSSRQGYFEFLGLDADSTHSLTFRKMGFVYQRQNDLKVTARHVFNLIPEAKIHFQVKKGEEFVSEKPRVHLLKIDGANWNQIYEINNLGGDEFEIAGLPSGEFQLSASVEHEGIRWRTYHSSPFTLESGQVHRGLTLKLSDFVSIKGVVRDRETGKALPGVLVEPDRKSRSTKNVNLMSDLQGNYRVPDLPLGSYRVEFKLEGYRTQTLSLSVNGQSDEIRDIYLSQLTTETVSDENSKIKSGMIRGMVTDQNGRALPGILIRLEGRRGSVISRPDPKSSNKSKRSRKTYEQPRTDDAGRFEFRDLPEGDYYLRYYSFQEEYGRWNSKRIRLSPDQVHTENIVLEKINFKELLLKGKVVDDSGEILEGAQVHFSEAYTKIDNKWVEIEDRRLDSKKFYDQAKTDSNGIFTLGMKVEDKPISAVRISAHLYTDEITYNLDGDNRFPYREGELIEVVLTKKLLGRVHLNFYKADGTPAVNTSYMIQRKGFFGGGGSSLNYKTGGRKSLSFPEGDYEIFAATESCVDIFKEFKITAGESIELDLQPKEFGSIEGLCLNADGEPLEGIRVSIADYHWSNRGRCPKQNLSTNSEGRFLMDSLPPGRYRISLGGGKYRGLPYDQIFEVQANQVTSLELELSTKSQAKVLSDS